MIKLTDILKEILQEESNPFGKVCYHGSPHKLTLDSLDITRTTLARDTTGQISKGITETASIMTGTGFYVTLDLWMNNGEEWYSHVKNPVFKEGTQGPESAMKYAGTDFPRYIYEVVLADDIHLEKYDIEVGSNGWNVSKNQREKFLEKNIDGLYDGKVEAVILNKDKIKSIRLAYKAEDYMKRVTAVDETEIKGASRLLSPNRYHEFEIQMQYVDVIPSTLESYLNEILGEKFTILGNKEASNYVVSNIPEDYLDLPSRYDITKYKFYTVGTATVANWTKV